MTNLMKRGLSTAFSSCHGAMGHSLPQQVVTMGWCCGVRKREVTDVGNHIFSTECCIHLQSAVWQAFLTSSWFSLQVADNLLGTCWILF
jgi:hypothetical protein